MREKQVQIPESLFYDLVSYHLMENQTKKEQIENKLEEKLSAMAAHSTYTTYKTASSEGDREEARKRYLNQRGISQDFRW